MRSRNPIIEHNIPALRRYAYALTRDHADADDLVQSALERALSKWHLRRSDKATRSWLFTILHNLFISDRRRRGRQGVSVELDDLTDSGRPAEQEAVMELSQVLAALDTLEEERKAVLLLVTVEGFSYDEAAAVLGVPAGTVMSRLSRARADLRRALDPDGKPMLRRVK